MSPSNLCNFITCGSHNMNVDHTGQEWGTKPHFLSTTNSNVEITWLTARSTSSSWGPNKIKKLTSPTQFPPDSIPTTSFWYIHPKWPTIPGLRHKSSTQNQFCGMRRHKTSYNRNAQRRLRNKWIKESQKALVDCKVHPPRWSYTMESHHI